MSGTTTSPPATPLKKRSTSSVEEIQGFDYYKSPTSATDGDESSIDGDESAPPTPAAHQFSPPGPQRRRSVTLAVMPNHLDSIHSHSIFKLTDPKSKANTYEDVQIHGDDGTSLYVDETQFPSSRYYAEKKELGTSHHVTFSPAIKTVSPPESSHPNYDAEVHDSTLDQSDALDLAKNGLPSACIFVANLASSQTDEQLLKSVQAHFKKFGRVHVKIRRDSKGNPYSFCQFESDEIARTAVREGRHAVIDVTGRRIRCEPAKVNRTLVLERRDCAVFDRAEAEKALFGYGRLEAIEFAPNFNHPPARGINSGKRCYARFVYRQDAVDCYQYFRCHAVWAADWTHNFPAIQLMAVPRIQVDEVDRQSVFVGKLNPSKTTETLLRKRFDQYGPVSEVHLFSKNKNGVGRIAFAFIKYESEEDALKAIDEENNTEFLGNIIHVQHREIHKKSGNTSYQHHGDTQYPGYCQPWAPTDLSNRPIGAPVMLNLRDVADLAAKLSYQMDFKRSQANPSRNQSNVSHMHHKVYSNSGDVSAMQQPIPRRESYQNNNSTPTDFRFRHNFQIPGIYNSNAFTAASIEQPLSPRSANATLRKSVNYQASNSGETSPVREYEPAWQSIFPGYYNSVSTQAAAGHALHPYTFGGQVQYFHPGHLIPSYHTNMNRRSSVNSVDYEVHSSAQSDLSPGQAAHSSAPQH